MATTLGIVFSNIHDSNIPELTAQRTIASVPFGGRYRLIDFALSNMINSGITKVGVITKSNYQSLMDHLGSGKDWDLARKRGGLIILPPFGVNDSNSLYNTRLEALKGITSFISRSNEEYVVMTDCDNVCSMDFADIIEKHVENNADVTMVYKKIQFKKDINITASILDINSENRITDISGEILKRGESNVFLNVFVMKRCALQNMVQDAIKHGHHHFTGDILAKSVKSLKLYAYEHKGYYAGIYSLQSYFQNNMDVLNRENRNMLFNERGVFTKIRDSAPAKYGASSSVKNSIIADGCQIDGEVENCILFRGVKVGRNAVVKNCILMQDTIVGEYAELDYVIADKNAVIKDRRTLAGCETHPFFINKNESI